MVNTGQTCNALTRMIVHESRYNEAVELAKSRAEALVVGDPTDPDAFVGAHVICRAKAIGTGLY